MFNIAYQDFEKKKEIMIVDGFHKKTIGKGAVDPICFHMVKILVVGRFRQSGPSRIEEEPPYLMSLRK